VKIALLAELAKVNAPLELSLKATSTKLILKCVLLAVLAQKLAL
jgi:hypothetical protein